MFKEHGVCPVLTLFKTFPSIYIWHDLGLFRSRDVTGQVTIWYHSCHFLYRPRRSIV